MNEFELKCPQFVEVNAEDTQDSTDARRWEVCLPMIHLRTDADNMSETRRKEIENSVLTLVIVFGFCRSKRLFIIHHDVFPLQVPACRLLCYLPLSGLSPPPPKTFLHPDMKKVLETMNRTTIRVHNLQSSVYRRALSGRQQTWLQYRGIEPRLSCFLIIY